MENKSPRTSHELLKEGNFLVIVGRGVGLNGGIMDIGVCDDGLWDWGAEGSWTKEANGRWGDVDGLEEGQGGGSDR